MSLGDALVDRVLAEFTAAELSLHSADPGKDGAHEVDGYNRHTPPQWERTGEGGMRTAEDVLFSGLPRTSVRYVGFWGAGAFLGGKQVVQRDVQAGDSVIIRAGELAVYQLMVGD